MALVFVTHAHEDEELARKLEELLCDALALTPEDFFRSSEPGRGVAPSTSIRSEILQQLSKVPAQIVLLTPNSAPSPWVWLEVGGRLGREGATPPFFLVPSGDFASLMQPLSDLRCLTLNDAGELHELVEGLGDRLGKQRREAHRYQTALDDLTSSTERTFGVRSQRRRRARAWFRQNAAAVFLATMLGLVTFALGLIIMTSRDESPNEVARNVIAAEAAGKLAQLKGIALVPASESRSAEVVPQAAVMVTRGKAHQDPKSCDPPECADGETDNNGVFSVNLAEIGVHNGEFVILSIVKSGFTFYSRTIQVDVKAIELGLLPEMREPMTRDGAR